MKPFYLLAFASLVLATEAHAGFAAGGGSATYAEPQVGSGTMGDMPTWARRILARQDWSVRKPLYGNPADWSDEDWAALSGSPKCFGVYTRDTPDSHNTIERQDYKTQSPGDISIKAEIDSRGASPEDGRTREEMNPDLSPRGPTVATPMD